MKNSNGYSKCKNNGTGDAKWGLQHFWSWVESKKKEDFYTVVYVYLHVTVFKEKKSIDR